MVMKVKTSELTGTALDWAVAKCEGWIKGDITHPKFCRLWRDQIRTPAAYPSTNWAQGGPIIEREITKVFRNVGGTWSAMLLKDVPIPFEERGTSLALTRRAQWNGAGPTPLIAAMRCYVASKLGDIVEVPEELFE